MFGFGMVIFTDAYGYCFLFSNVLEINPDAITENEISKHPVN